MSALILAEDKLHHGYYRADNKITITQDSGVIVGHEFDKCIDGNSSTYFKSSDNNPIITITFPTAVVMNGFVVYGYSGAPRLDISYDEASNGFVAFPEINSSNPDPARSTFDYGEFAPYKPKDNGGGPFGAAFREGEHVTVKTLRIQFSNIENERIECIAFGMWVRTQLNLQLPFNVPALQATENAMKRGPKAAYLRSNVRTVGEKIKLQFGEINLDDLYRTDIFEKDNFDAELKQTINGDTRLFPLIEYLGHYTARYPFFVMHELGQASDLTFGTFGGDVGVTAKITYCVPYKTSNMPRFVSASSLSWSISALGYFS